MRVLKQLNRAWRVLATGLCFGTFGLGGLGIAYIIFPLVTLGVRDPRRRKRRIQAVISVSFKLFLTMMRLLGVARFRYFHFERLADDTGTLIVANHPTLIDYVVIIARLKQCDLLVKDRLWHNFFVRRIVTRAGYLPNSGEASMLFERVRQSVACGHNLLIFPEGTRTTPGQAPVLQRGAANLAVRLNIPVRILHVQTSKSGLTKEDKWYKVPPEKVDYRVVAGEKINPQPFLEQYREPARAARALTRYLREQLQKDPSYGQSGTSSQATDY